MNITFFCPVDLNDVNLNSQLLNQLLAVGKNRIINHTMAELICQQFSVPATPDYPLAALTAGIGPDTPPHYYLQSDPVHLILQRDAFTLSDPAALALSQADLQALCDLLNQHFFEEDFTFELSKAALSHTESDSESSSSFSQNKLLLRLNNPPKISTTLPEKVVARNVYDYLPQGENASYWNKITNEIQMLLHEHALNQQRELHQLPAINSIWLSAGGTLPKVAATCFNQVISDICYVQTLAKLAKVECELVSKPIPFVLNQNILIALKPNTDMAQWLDVLYKLVQQGATLQLNLAHQDAVLVCEIKPRDLYKLWLINCLRKVKLRTKNKTVLSYFQAYYQRVI